MSQDPELERWQAEWQSLGGRERLAEELTNRVEKDGRRIRRSVTMEIAGSVFGSALCVWLIALRHGELVTTLACASLLASFGIYVTYLLLLRKDERRAASVGLDAFVELTRRRLQDDLRWHLFARRWLVVLAMLLVPWSIWAFVAHYPIFVAEPWRAAVGFGAEGTGIFLTFFFYRRKQRRLEAERDRFESLVAARTIT